MNRQRQVTQLRLLMISLLGIAMYAVVVAVLWLAGEL